MNWCKNSVQKNSPNDRQKKMLKAVVHHIILIFILSMYFDSFWRENRQKRSSPPVCHPAKYLNKKIVADNKITMLVLAMTHDAYLTANFVRDIFNSSWRTRFNFKRWKSTRNGKTPRDSNAPSRYVTSCRLPGLLTAQTNFENRNIILSILQSMREPIAMIRFVGTIATQRWTNRSSRLVQERNLKYRKIIILNKQAL